MTRVGGSKHRVLVVAAHPDDEVLGCGGVIARHGRAGDRVDILILAEGATSRDRARNPKARGEEIERLRQAARKAAKALGASAPRFGGLPDNRMDSLDLIDVIKLVEGVIAASRPDTVYVHHADDLNIDHRIAHQAVLTACRPLPGASVRSIYAFETPSSTEWAGPSAAFRPNRHVAIGEVWAAKAAALEAYAGEIRPYPHARSIEGIKALAQWRGVAAGVPMAEAFEIVRQVRP
jgi:LmbE family N-acetylglucosaminyl deacetylase